MVSSDALTEAVKTAKKVVEDAGLSAPLDSVAFEVVLNHLLGGPPFPLAGGPLGGGATPPADVTDQVLKVAAGLEVDPSVLDEILHFDEDGQPHFSVAPSRLRKTASEGARQISVLLCAARKFALSEGWTSYEAIRQASDENGVYDSKNFSVHMGSTADWLRVKGAGKNREFQLKPSAAAKAAEWARTFAGDKS